MELLTSYKGDGDKDAFIADFEAHLFKKNDTQRVVAAILKFKLIDLRGTDGMNQSPQQATYNALSSSAVTKELLRIMDYREGAVYGLSGRFSSLAPESSLKRMICISSIEFFEKCNDKDLFEESLEVLNRVIDLSEGMICCPYSLLKGDRKREIAALTSVGFVNEPRAEILVLSNAKQQKFNKKQVRREVSRKRKLA